MSLLHSVNRAAAHTLVISDEFDKVLVIQLPQQNELSEFHPADS
jgi:hypothetical protein